MDDDLRTLAREVGERGEVVLRQRGRGDAAAYELIVNGAFAMDSVETHSERALADLVTAGAAGGEGPRVLLGGLGLGYTAWELLQHDVGRVDVVELEPCLIRWARQSLTPVLGRVAADPRVRLHAGDILDVLGGAGPFQTSGPWDAVLLDVDNGPDFLIHDSNAGLYQVEALAQAYARLAPGGTLAIWCQGPAPELLTALRRVAAGAEERFHRVQRGERRFSYVIYTLTRPWGDPEPE